jgi:hypothetical protein
MKDQQIQHGYPQGRRTTMASPEDRDTQRDAYNLETDRARHPDAPVGKETKYARIERERRFLLATRPVGTPVQRVRIEDRYLRDTRLRLRRMTDLDGPATRVIYKLTQKIPSTTGSPGLITTLYMSAAEYASLAGLPAATLAKVRSSFPPLGVDAFEGSLRGLILAEAEFEDAIEEKTYRPPAEAVMEVTDDVRFTGGRLVSLSSDEVADLLVSFGIVR